VYQAFKAGKQHVMAMALWFRQRQSAAADAMTLPFIVTMVLTCLRGALPPVLLRAVCLVRAMVSFWLMLVATNARLIFVCESFVGLGRAKRLL
jgi:hypothetical protein